MYTITYSPSEQLIVAVNEAGQRVGACEWFAPITAASDSWEIAEAIFQRAAIATVEHDRETVFVGLK